MGASRALEFEGRATPAEVADALTRIADEIRAGSLLLSLGDDELAVRPEGTLSLEVWATERKGKSKVEIAVAWRRAAGSDEGV